VTSHLAVSARRGRVPSGVFLPSARATCPTPMLNATRSALSIAIGGHGVIEGRGNLWFPPAGPAPTC
jgi:hypothetical protein